MEEGRRMFQIFAARMFEQRVLTAYREKVAEQRQQKLIEELLEEENRNEQRSAKKARESQKKKDRKRLQKQAKEEEKARRDAEKAAEEATAKAEQERKAEEQRKKREEQRKKRDAERKAQEEERARKEAEKQRRLREERDRQAETERKQREQKEQEKKQREEERRKEREAKEMRVKEQQERKALKEQARVDRESAAKATQEARERDIRAQGKRPSHSGPVPIPSSVQNAQTTPASLCSPRHQVAAPVIPKASTPARTRQPPQQDSHTSSPRSQATNAEYMPVSPRSMPLSQPSTASSGASKGKQQPMLHHPQPPTSMSPLGSTNRSHPPAFPSINGLPTYPPGMGAASRPSVGPELPAYPPHSGAPPSQLRGFPASNGIPPGVNGSRMVPPARAFPFETGHGLPLHSQQPMTGAFSQQGGLSQTHSRQTSGSFERSPLETTPQGFPMTRPSPIKRPSSATLQNQHKGNHDQTQRDVDDLSAHLGSSALLDDADDPYTSNLSQSLPGATAPGSLPIPTRASVGASSLFPDPLSGKSIDLTCITISLTNSSTETRQSWRRTWYREQYLEHAAIWRLPWCTNLGSTTWLVASISDDSALLTLT